jgi:hypothetical protein
MASPKHDEIQMTDQIDFKDYIGRPVKDVVEELSQRFPDHEVGEVRTDWFITADYRLDRVRVYYHPGSDAVSEVAIG